MPVKIQHPDLRNCVYTLIHMGRPLRRKILCGVCNQVHLHKTYHLALNALGEVTVSDEIFRRLEEAGLDGLQAVGEDHSPEPQRIAVGAPLEFKPVVSREHGIVRGDGNGR